jgi:hypothetical protein
MKRRISSALAFLLFVAAPAQMARAGQEDPPEHAAAPAGEAGSGSGGEVETEGSPAVSIEVHPQEVRLGDPVVVTIRIANGGGKYQLPSVLKLGAFTERSRSRDTEIVEGRPLDVIRLEVAAYEDVGKLEIPAFRLVTAQEDGGSEEGLEVPPVSVKVKSVLEGIEQPEPRDVVSPVSVVVRDYRLLVAAGLVVFWLLAAFGLRLRRAPVMVPARLEDLPPARLAHEIALQKLGRVVEDDLLRQGKFQEFFIRVSDTVREYLGNRYRFFALDLTTRELLEELRDRPTPGLEHGALKKMLAEADLVKFAKVTPTDEMSSRSIDDAYSLVESTKQVEEVESE